MDELFEQLETRIHSLLRRCDYLYHSNNDLKQSKFMLVREKEGLIAKNKTAISQIENMVSRLKLIEKSQ